MAETPKRSRTHYNVGAARVQKQRGVTQQSTKYKKVKDSLKLVHTQWISELFPMNIHLHVYGRCRAFYNCHSHYRGNSWSRGMHFKTSFENKIRNDLQEQSTDTSKRREQLETCPDTLPNSNLQSSLFL